MQPFTKASQPPLKLMKLKLKPASTSSWSKKERANLQFRPNIRPTERSLFWTWQVYGDGAPTISQPLYVSGLYMFESVQTKAIHTSLLCQGYVGIREVIPDLGKFGDEHKIQSVLRSIRCRSREQRWQESKIIDMARSEPRQGRICVLWNSFQNPG